MMMRLYVLAPCILYFWLWGYFSNWSLYEMLFYENDIKGTAARLVVGFFLLAASTVALTEAQKP
jgi:hypothetical protein